MNLCKELLSRECLPFKYVLTYKFSQDSMELLFNKICQRSGCNNNPNSVQFKGALKQVIIRNCIQPSKTGNCTDFEDNPMQTSGLLDFTHRKQEPLIPESVTKEPHNSRLINLEQLLSTLGTSPANYSQDNVLYYLARYVVQVLLKKEQCEQCRQEQLLNKSHQKATQGSIPQFASLTQRKQQGGLVLASEAVMKIICATEREFKARVINSNFGIVFHRNLSLQSQSYVLHSLRTDVFCPTDEHFFDHRIGEVDHLSRLLKKIVAKYLDMRLKRYAKKFTEEIAHRNVPSERHQLTKMILFKNQ